MCFALFVEQSSLNLLLFFEEGLPVLLTLLCVYRFYALLGS